MSDFWQGKKVFLTGHTGFKGGWLSLWLESFGAQVYGYALNPSSAPNLFSIANVGKSLASSTIADIRDATALEKAILLARPDIVFHLAAQPLVRYSYTDPVETYATNVMGTVNLFEAVRKTPSVRAVINITTDKCYENIESLRAYKEDDAMGGYDPYSSSKGCSELVTAAYRRSFLAEAGVAIASARAGNVIGGGDWAEDRLIPDMMRAITNGQSVNIRNPHSIRPWQHVLGPLSGYLLLAQKLYENGPDFAEGWNFGPDDDDAKSVQWILDTLTKTWGEGASWKPDGGDHPHEAHYLKLDCSKAKERLNWQPRWSLATAIEQICVWHKAHLAGADMEALCLHQIQQYQTANI